METTYPQQYLHVTECRSGETWIMPLKSNAQLDLTRQVKRWIAREFENQLKLSGKIMPRIDGDYYAKLMLDGRAPDSCVCWQSGGFYLEDN